MHRVALALALIAALAACAETTKRTTSAPAPLAPLPPLAPPEQAMDTADSPESPALPPRPEPTGDTEIDALRIGFWGCQVMGIRIAPSMSGRALLRVRLSGDGQVLDVAPVIVEGLPRMVVSCVVDRARAARFRPRGGDGSEIEIPVIFAPASRRPATPAGDKSPSQST